MKAILKYTRIHLYQSNVNLIVCNLRDSPILIMMMMVPYLPQRLPSWAVRWAAADRAAASQTSPAPPLTPPPRASASPPACRTSPCTSSTRTAPASRNPT